MAAVPLPLLRLFPLWQSYPHQLSSIQVRLRTKLLVLCCRNVGFNISNTNITSGKSICCTLTLRQSFSNVVIDKIPLMLILWKKAICFVFVWVPAQHRLHFFCIPWYLRSPMCLFSPFFSYSIIFISFLADEHHHCMSHCSDISWDLKHCMVASFHTTECTLLLNVCVWQDLLEFKGTEWFLLVLQLEAF